MPEFGPRHHPARLAPRLARVPLRGRAAARVGQAQPGCLGAERRPPDAFTGSGGDDLVVMVHHPPEQRRSCVAPGDDLKDGSGQPLILFHAGQSAAASCERRAASSDRAPAERQPVARATSGERQTSDRGSGHAGGLHGPMHRWCFSRGTSAASFGGIRSCFVRLCVARPSKTWGCTFRRRGDRAGA